MTELIWSFSPWLAFLAATRVTSLYGSVAAGALAAAIVTGRALARRRMHLLDLAGLGYFLALGAALAAIHPAHLDYWSRYAQAGSHAALTVIVFGSILAGHPFTESYARETTPAALWHTAGFRAASRRISAVWGLAFLAGTISLIIAGSTGGRPVLLRILIPFGTLYLAYRYTGKQAHHAQQAPGASPAADPAASRRSPNRADPAAPGAAAALPAPHDQGARAS
jgi:hypothetical protein